MSSVITVDDDDDAAFQADLARAIAASLEPDSAGSLEDTQRAEDAGWNALLAAGQAATSPWGGPGVGFAGFGIGATAGRRSPAAPPSLEEDDDDFQRQMDAAMAASIQSAYEEDSRRRRGGEAVLDHHFAELPPPAAFAPAQPAHGPQLLHQQQQQPVQLPSQGRLREPGAVCCSSGLLLKPLGGRARAAGTWDGAALPPVPTAALAPAASPFGAGGMLAVAAAVPDLLGPTPACSPCSSAVDSEANGGAGAALGGAAVGAGGRRPESFLPVRGSLRDLALDMSSGGHPDGAPAPAGFGSLLPLLPLSPAKHARTPSLAGATDAAQPQMKRSRSASESGAAAPPPSAAADPRVTGRPPSATSTAAVARFRSTTPGLPAPSCSPPERPASAASGCTTSAAAAAAAVVAAVAMELAGAAVATSSGLASISTTMTTQPPEQVHEDAFGASLLNVGAGARGGGGIGSDLEALAASLPPLAPHDLRQWPEHPLGGTGRQQVGSGGGVGAGEEGGGLGGPTSKQNAEGSTTSSSGRLALDLSPCDSAQHHKQQQQPCPQPLPLCGRGPQQPAERALSSSSSQRRWYGSLNVGGAATRPRRGFRVTPLDLSCLKDHQGTHGFGPGACVESYGSAVLRWDDDPPAAPPVATFPAQAPAADSRTHADAKELMEIDPTPDAVAPSHFASAAHTRDAKAGAAATNAAAVTAPSVASWGYSGADRRMLLHQRVWWWLGPGQVRVGRISAIDRRSEPLLYSIRLEADGPLLAVGAAAAPTETIVATADCLFPFLAHGDKLMCRLPPAFSAAVRLDDPGAAGLSGSSDSSISIRNCEAVDGGSGFLSQHQQQLQSRHRSLEEWPGVGVAASAAASAASSCAWMCGTLQHCIFDGAAPMVHVLLGPEELPYLAPYELVVPVSDAAEGSGCASAASTAAAALAVAAEMAAMAPGPVYGPNPCMDIVPVGPAA